MADIGAAGKPMILVFNKIDAYTYIEKAADDLTPRTKENLTLEELMKTWMAKMEDNCLFISARERINVEELKSVVYQRVKNCTCRSIPITISLSDLRRRSLINEEFKKILTFLI